MKEIDREDLIRSFRFFGLFLFVGVAVFPMPALVMRLSGSVEIFYAIRTTLSASLLCTAVILRKRGPAGKLWQVLFAFFIASLVAIFQATPEMWQLLSGAGLGGIDLLVAFQLLSTLLIVIPIIVLTKVSGGSLDSIYLNKGNLLLGVFVGVTAFFIFAATSIPVAALLFRGRELTLARLIGWAPWLLAFVLSNGLREELWFRGVFLKKFQAVLGNKQANFLQATIFTLFHVNVSYTPFLPLFLGINLILGLVLGALMRRTNSLLGPAIFHAGADVPIILALFSNT